MAVIGTLCSSRDWTISNVDCDKTTTERPLAYARRLPQPSAPAVVVAGPVKERCAQIIRGESEGIFPARKKKEKEKKDNHEKRDFQSNSTQNCLSFLDNSVIQSLENKTI